MNIAKNAILNVWILILGIFASILLTRLDFFFGIDSFRSSLAMLLGGLILLAGIFLRFWATFLFHQHKMKVVSLKPQATLLKTGPYNFSRNPLYLGIVSVFFGLALILGSLSAVFFAVLIFIGWDVYVRLFEEKNLERIFGSEYASYKKGVSRWLKIGFIKI